MSNITCALGRWLWFWLRGGAALGKCLLATLLVTGVAPGGGLIEVSQAAVVVEGFTSNLPILVLRAGQPGMISTSKTYSPVELAIHEPGENGKSTLTNAPTSTVRARLRVRGMVSRLFPKLSYRLQLGEPGGKGIKAPLLGMPAGEDWVLHAGWLDKSLIRNAFSYDLARAMGCAAMRTRPCEVLLQPAGKPLAAADYLGVYQLVEHIERGPDRVNVTKLAPDENTEPAITGGYLLAWDVGPGTYLPTWKSIQVRSPNQPSPQQLRWIDREFTRFDQTLRGPDSRDPAKGYAAYIDVDAWINYILIEELMVNLDGYIRSFYLHKERGGKIRPGPVWDHDLAMGHQFPRGTDFTRWWYIDRAPPHGWIARLMDDPAFRAKMARRWAALRAGVLSDPQVSARIDTFARPLILGAADRNFERWKILNVERPFRKPDDYITIASDTYIEQIRALKKFLRERAAWMDAHLAAP